jgi:hypothetical protein
MDDTEVEVLLKGVEVAVVVEQDVALAQAEGGVEAVHGAAHRDAEGAEVAEVLGCGDCQFGVDILKDVEPAEGASNPGQIPMIPYASQDLTEDERGDGNALSVARLLHPDDLGGGISIEVLNEDGGIGDDHDQASGSDERGRLGMNGASANFAGRLSVDLGGIDVFAGDLSEEAEKFFLTLDIEYEAKGSFHGCLLGGCAGGGHGLAHELVVDVDVGAHR